MRAVEVVVAFELGLVDGSGRLGCDTCLDGPATAFTATFSLDFCLADFRDLPYGSKSSESDTFEPYT